MRLLIIEDEISILEALQKGLKKEGYAVDIVSDGNEAMEYLELNSYDLVVLDINLPGIDGLSILRNLRKEDIDTRVIIISANREIEDRIKGLDLGANDYLVKPFDFQELKARIRSLLRRKFVSQPNILQESGIEINLSTLKVTYKERDIPLTLKEYGILKYLIENKGRAVSSEELFEHVWDEHSDPFSKVIRVHIYSLRKKLVNATGKDNIITTLKGVGYLFVGGGDE
ncbi:response regulator transcription factor [Cellulosilyticum sp. ST5]|uniref:response regulator transcription factor n=1 Tax=unclassified Cellulosilyticum TaxID=2643091 RepID=UPI000F8D4C4D|nr:response regulator transcription factor [Cellulosilyticum sp. WCF-2]QEH67593.1 response regulator transcription factor [Cellulosilyticum sp. WCF-2]